MTCGTSWSHAPEIWADQNNADRDGRLSAAKVIIETCSHSRLETRAASMPIPSARPAITILQQAQNWIPCRHANARCFHLLNKLCGGRGRNRTYNLSIKSRRVSAFSDLPPFPMTCHML